MPEPRAGWRWARALDSSGTTASDEQFVQPRSVTIFAETPA
jgi:hypothetical protein